MEEITQPTYRVKNIIGCIISGFLLMSTYALVQTLVSIGFDYLPYIIPANLYDQWEPILTQFAFQDTILCLLLLILYLIYYLVSRHRFKPEGKFKLIYFRKPDKIDILSGILVVLAGGSISFTWITLVDFIKQHIPFLQTSLDSFTEQGEMLIDNNWYIFTLLSVAILGPIVEELLMRGLIFGEMHPKMPIALAIVLNGVIFGVFHGNFVQAVYTAILGMAYAYVYYYTESFWLVCGMHIFNNFKETLPPINEAVDNGLSIGFLILGYICIIPAIIAMKYLYKKSIERGIEDGIYGN